ncbi:acetyl-CoA C-acetyltransferase [Tamaricihabitans halophyticus]|uniref:Acetyl-CoA C-acetyltransferase n=1 Tax=Tamaricihabitans halophyticus TaxID=1262583 RepID=A0A4R2QMY9_9PSEU|nr:acetyl-CoA acetyltransferase [Tamaricihabitans halophyticus]TCP49948.1 acetyl-CoA C-acetyltransferase [Tamaricihabitans halophyticus]
MTDLSPDTPVLVGVGQASERVDDAGYQRRSAVELAAAAARAALADADADVGAGELATAIDTVAGVRQFEISAPGMPALLGKSDNYPRSVAKRLGAEPRRAILEVVGGQAPQHLVTELAGTIAAGAAEVALVFGAEAISTARHLATAADRPDFTEHVAGDLEDRGYGFPGVYSSQFATHGLLEPASQYALCDNARRARLGMSRADYALAMGELFAPFTKVASANPHAAAPVERDTRELATPSERNRMITDPYTRFLISREQVNQGAAALLMSVGAARRLGVPTDNWVFLHGHADVHEQEPIDRADLSAAPASVLAIKHALEVAGIDLDKVSALDLYSCFPIAVFAICDGLGLAPDDPRGLTLTGGLPFFGGAGNNYSMHAIAEAAARVRAEPGSYALVGANGGVLGKYSAGIYSTTPTPWRADRSDELQAEVDAWPAPEQAEEADGWARIETYTVKYARDGQHTGIVLGRLEQDDRRFVARAADDDAEMLALLAVDEPIGRRVYVRSFGFGNRVTTGEARMDELFPAQPAG